MQIESYEVLIDPKYPHFGLRGEPTPHRQHPNQTKGLDLYVSVINFDTHELCWKKLYENTKGRYFKHTGYSSMYIHNFTESCTVVPFQIVRKPNANDPDQK